MKIEVVQGDITQLHVDVIVNAANSSLFGGGGVDGAIHRVAGPKLLEECKKIRKEHIPDGLPTGEVALTHGYNLPAKYVIHAVGPIYNTSRDQGHLLANCFVNSLNLAEQHKLESIAFPAISTGVHGYPKREAASIAFETLKRYHYKSIKRVIVCVFSEEDKAVFDEVFK